MVHLIRFFFVVLAFTASAVAADVPRKAVSIEGVTAWQLSNGLKLLTLPDPGADNVRVNIV